MPILQSIRICLNKIKVMYLPLSSKCKCNLEVLTPVVLCVQFLNAVDLGSRPPTPFGQSSAVNVA